MLLRNWLWPKLSAAVQTLLSILPHNLKSITECFSQSKLLVTSFLKGVLFSSVHIFSVFLYIFLLCIFLYFVFSVYICNCRKPKFSLGDQKSIKLWFWFINGSIISFVCKIMQVYSFYETSPALFTVCQTAGHLNEASEETYAHTASSFIVNKWDAQFGPTVTAHLGLKKNVKYPSPPQRPCYQNIPAGGWSRRSCH